MTESRRLETLKNLLETQIGLIAALAEDEAGMQKALLGRDWTQLDDLIKRMKATAQEIDLVESERHRLYLEMREELGLRSDDSFYDFLAKAPEEYRDSLADLYRRLRFSVAQVRSLTGGIDAYVSSTMSTIGKILEEMFPSRKIRLYGRNGARKLREQPLVLNHSL